MQIDIPDLNHGEKSVDANFRWQYKDLVVCL